MINRILPKEAYFERKLGDFIVRFMKKKTNIINPYIDEEFKDEEVYVNENNEI